ncbi:5'-3' exonuclease [Jatrophihabitans fulvus]
MSNDQPDPASASAAAAAPRGTVLAIDGNSLVHRSYHAQARTGQPSWAVRGLLTQLVAAVERIRPVAVVVGFDDPDRSLRRETWPQYKSQRADKLDTLVAQLADAVVTLRQLGAHVVVPPGLEADDVLCSTSAQAAAGGLRTVVVTSDRDAFALIDEHTDVLRIIDGGVDASPVMTPDRLELLLGVRPHQYRDFAALRGDPSDNLIGVRGVGPRTAAALLAAFGSAAAAFDDLDEVAVRCGRGVAGRLGADGARAAWELNCRVMAMHDDLDLAPVGSVGVLPWPAADVEAVYLGKSLTWTAAQAVRVLAEQEPAAAAPRYVETVARADALRSRPGPSARRSQGARRLAPLAVTPRRGDQLALF